MNALDDQDQGPVIGRKVLRWYRQRVTVLLFGVPPNTVKIEAEIRDRVVDWFVERADEYLLWSAFDKYMGPGYAHGEWSIPRDRINEDVELAYLQCLADRARDRDAARFPTLEEWLTAEGRGELQSDPFKEPGARSLLKRGARARWLAQRNRILKGRPRVCADCHREFAPRALNSKRCHDCLAARRAAQESRKAKRATQPRRRRTQ